MTDRATLEALLARVLEGTGPDRELDAEIEACLTGRVTHPRNPGWTFEKQDAEWKLARLADSPFISQASRPAPPYTASLDAALTLVPEGWGWSLFSADPVLRTPSGACLVDSTYLPPDDPLEYNRPVVDVIAITPARALIAACIKARMEGKP